ncbi:MAG: FAD-dependent oxidoreductase [Gammaproteobacteria bacterium]|nr:FAD-dependent oxidoreductase [Gammaproteobacteria bacterium]
METPIRVVIVGNSAAGLSALEAFRKLDRSSSVHVISKEGSSLPYARVQIPYYLKDRVRRDNLYIREAGYFKDLNAETVEGRVSALDTTTGSVILEDGRTIVFDRLLIASGSSPVVPSITGIDSAGIHHIWTMDDAQALKPVFETGKRILIIGGGFIAMQAAWAAAQCELSAMLVVRSTIMRRDLDDQARELLKRAMADHGVSLVEGEIPSLIAENTDRSLRVEFPDRQAVEVDAVVVATGVQPNTAFLDGRGIAIDGGVLVDRHMQTNIPGIYAAGDVAAAITSDGRDHIVRALWPCAAEQGEVAGANLAGRETTYQGSLNMNVTELFGLVIASCSFFSVRC